MNDKKFRKLIFTALTPILVPCSESEKLRQSHDLQPYRWCNIPGTAQRLLNIQVSSRDDIERGLLINKAQEWIGKCTMQSNLFSDQKQNVLIVK